ncbi:acyltransferase family protein [Mycolicibacterium holsaticum]|uniref:acyltransferase family protein n=1 Tax=Mycolicibacterium holsaticum TaxID=152142 RepID=UPI001E41F60B|nr:acyltransferase family protein [Mycolicibacterium holsaticum]
MPAVKPYPAAQAVHRRVRDDLNGLRGIAIALVVVYHIWFGRVSGGVDVFLVLSGFFLGGRLLRQAAEPGADEPLSGALIRLVRRLCPALVVVLAASAVLTVVIQPQTRWEAFADQSLASLGYFQNWYLAVTANDYLRAGQGVSPLQHIWSMSVQGQFFVAMLLIAWLVMIASDKRGWGARRRQVLVAVTGVATVASFTYAVFAHHLDQTSAYYDSFARAWQLLAGVLAAAVIAVVRMPGWLRAAAALTGLAMIVGCGILIDGAAQFPGPWALVPVGATILLIFSGAGAEGKLPWPNRLMAAGPLVTLGAMAYALYLWHWPLLIFAMAFLDRDVVGLRGGVLLFAASLLLAYLTWRFVEDPLRKTTGTTALAPQPVRGRARRLTAALGTVVALLAVTLCVTSFGWRDHIAGIRANGNELSSLSPRDYPGARALIEPVRVPALPMRPSILEAADDLPATTTDGCITDFASTEVIRCVYGDPGATRTIALAGGSHSEHWIAGLDLLGVRHGFRVVTYLKMGCPLTTDDDPRNAVTQEPYPECRSWVRDALDALVADRPDYVFTTTTRPHPAGPGDMVPDGYLGVWDELDANDIAILGLRDTPWMYRDGTLFAPVDCLAEGGDAELCGLPRHEALAERNPTYDYLGRYRSMSILDLSDAVCRVDICRAVEGNVLVYHDAHHLSSTYVRTLADELGRQLSDVTGWW